jgi:hypothetical protein
MRREVRAAPPVASAYAITRFINPPNKGAVKAKSPCSGL